jgi:hypothetical protein
VDLLVPPVQQPMDLEPHPDPIDTEAIAARIQAIFIIRQM